MPVLVPAMAVPVVPVLVMAVSVPVVPAPVMMPVPGPGVPKRSLRSWPVGQPPAQ
jgi:hypothetical protein